MKLCKCMISATKSILACTTALRARRQRACLPSIYIPTCIVISFIYSCNLVHIILFILILQFFQLTTSSIVIPVVRLDLFNLIVKFMLDKNSMLLHALTSTERGVFSPRFVIVILVVRLYLFDTKIMVDKNSMVLSTHSLGQKGPLATDSQSTPHPQLEPETISCSLISYFVISPTQHT